MEDMAGFDHLMSSSIGSQKISVDNSSDDDRFDHVVEMERFSHHHLMKKEDIINNSTSSRIINTRNLSRKGSVRNGEMKITGNDRDATSTSMLTISPKATLLLHGIGSSTPEKPTVVAVGATHHQITIITNGATTTTSNSSAVAATETKSKCVANKRFISFRRSTPPTWSWTSDPRRILIFFATLSSMGTILLIYFTLSMGKFNGDYNTSI